MRNYKRTPTLVQLELKRTIGAQTLHPTGSRAWRTLEMRRKALALELALTAPETYGSTLLAAGPL